MIMKSSKTDSVRRFLREHEILNMLDHPSIIKTYEISLVDEKSPPSILLEFCPKCIEQIFECKNILLYL